MGLKKKASYGGKCKVCNTEYAKDEDVFMQKEGDKWLICKDEECFKQQGGTIEEKKSGGKGYYKHPLQNSKGFADVAEKIIEEYIKKRVDHSDQTPTMLNISADAQTVMFTSIFNTLSAYYKE